MSIQVAANDMTSFFLVAEEYSVLCMYHVVFIRSSVGGHLGCFHILDIVNSAAVNAGGHGSFWTLFFSGCVPRDRIAMSHGNPTYPL